MADEVIKTTGLDVTVMDGNEGVVLTFNSRDQDPVRVSMPMAIADKLANFIKERLQAALHPAMLGGPEPEGGDPPKFH